MGEETSIMKFRWWPWNTWHMRNSTNILSDNYNDDYYGLFYHYTTHEDFDDWYWKHPRN